MVLISESASTRLIDGVWHSLLRCQRRRCNVQHTLPMQAEHVEPIYLPRFTQAERDDRHEKGVAFWKEAASHPLPAGWVQIRLAGEQGNDGISPMPHNFCSEHCAALWLNAYSREQES
jgi:hypothetical protein